MKGTKGAEVFASSGPTNKTPLLKTSGRPSGRPFFMGAGRVGNWGAGRVGSGRLRPVLPAKK